jgi:cell division protein FtsQ
MHEENYVVRKSPKKRKRARRRPSKLAYFLMILVVASCAAVVCAKTFFNVQKITVSGNSNYSAGEIEKCSGIKKGTSLFEINKQNAVTELCTSLPFIADAKIKIHLPDTVKIEVIADTPKYKINTKKDGTIYLDKDLKVLEKTAQKRNYKNLITINGGYITNFDVGKKITFKDESQSKAVSNLVKSVKEAGIDKITGLDVADSYQLKVVYDNRITIVVGTSLGATEKLQNAEQIIKSKLSASDKGSLDVSSDNKRYVYSPS